MPSSSCFRGNIIPQHDSDETLLIRDPETRANSDGRTNGTSHLTEVVDAEEAEKEEVHTLNLSTMYILNFEHIMLNKFELTGNTTGDP